jgi:WD40 repeat protein
LGPRSGERRFEIGDGAMTFALSPDSRLMAVGTVDGGVMLRDARTGAPQGPATKVADGSISQVPLSPDGRLFAAAAAGGTATVWDVSTRSRVGGEFPVAKGLLPAWRSNRTGGCSSRRS